jgi:hypothetical protein
MGLNSGILFSPCFREAHSVAAEGLLVVDAPRANRRLATRSVASGPVLPLAAHGL